MKMVIFDADTVAGKELPLHPITSLGEARVYELVPPERLIDRVAENVRAFLEGHPINVVNG